MSSDAEPTAKAELLDLEPRPTAIVCCNDKVAVGTMQAARERGLRVPQDLSVAGFDDIDRHPAHAGARRSSA